MYIRLLNQEFIRQVHDTVLEYHPGRKGDLHPEVLQMAVDRPKHYIYYEECNFHTVCAVILHTIATGHPFLDGNKRTALVVTIATYKINGIGLDFSQVNQEDFVDLMMWVVTKKPKIVEIAKRLQGLTNKYATIGAKRALQRAQYKFDNES